MTAASAKKIKLIVIVGPTASGKSELAVRLAKKFNGEIISADSRQIYCGLDVATGKVAGKRNKKGIFVYKSIPHHCIDEVNPRTQYSAAEFKICAERAIRDIAGRGKLPILAGGTGFWVDAVAHGLSLPQVRPDVILRKRLEKKGASELFRMLKKIDPARARLIDAQNPRRLVRAIEIARVLGAVPGLQKKFPFDTAWIGIRLPENILKRRIHRRLLKRMRLGMVREAQGLRKKGIPWKRFYELGLEYRFLADYLRGNISKKEMIRRIETSNWDYARRQLAWLRKNKEIRWIDDANEAEKFVRRFTPLERRRLPSAVARQSLMGV